jgi:RHS repeat-associated protein
VGVGVRWELADHLGSIRDVVSADGSMVLDHVEYGPFGTVASETNSASGGNILFTGLRLDRATGIVFADNRTLFVTTGQWMQEDPIQFQAGDANLRRYVRNDPTDAIDPSGLVIIVVHGVESDGKPWAWEMKKKFDDRSERGKIQEVYMFRWTTPAGKKPPVADGRNSINNMPAYQVEEAKRLKGFIDEANALFKKKKVNETINVIAHSQGTVITLKALDLGAQVDNVIFMGSPLNYTTDRQEEVLRVLKNIRGKLYNFYSPADVIVPRVNKQMRNERGWKGVPVEKVPQIPQNVSHTGFQNREVIRRNYLDKFPSESVIDRKDPEWGALMEKYRLEIPSPR